MAALSAMALAWVGTGYPEASFLVKGTELAVALCGAHSRFQICETRIHTRDTEYPYGLSYRVRDAATVSDEEVREGIVRSRIVAEFEDLDEAVNYCVRLDPPPPIEDDALVAA